jgi:hypothetical protein
VPGCAGMCTAPIGVHVECYPKPSADSAEEEEARVRWGRKKWVGGHVSQEEEEGCGTFSAQTHATERSEAAPDISPPDNQSRWLSSLDYSTVSETLLERRVKCRTNSALRVSVWRRSEQLRQKTAAPAGHTAAVMPAVEPVRSPHSRAAARLTSKHTPANSSSTTSIVPQRLEDGRPLTAAEEAEVDACNALWSDHSLLLTFTQLMPEQQRQLFGLQLHRPDMQRSHAQTTRASTPPAPRCTS